MIFRKAIIAACAGLMLAGAAAAEGGTKHAEPPEGGWPFEGAFGKFDEHSVQRGYQVYREVCSSCHGLKLMAYRNLGEPGGPYFDPEFPNPNDNPMVKAFAAEDQIEDGPDEVGDMFFRPGRPADTFRSPYANDNAARAANNGALPPDLSVITKARHSGATYVYNLLSGYATTDENGEIHVGGHGEGDHGGTLTVPTGQYYNPYFAGDVTPSWDGDPRHTPPGGFLAMPPQLNEGRVDYLDGTEASVDQMAYDVAQFLAWAGEPKQVNRKSLGLPVMIFLGFLALLLWISFKRIWAGTDH